MALDLNYALSILAIMAVVAMALQSKSEVVKKILASIERMVGAVMRC